MTLRSQLEGKKRRRVVVPVPIEDPGPARRRLTDALAALAAAEGAPELAGALDALREDVDAARQLVEACTAELVLAAPVATAAEAILAGHLGADGTPDYQAALPELLALCAEDEDLRDVDWWREQLARPEWGPDVAGLRLGVLYLVADAPTPLIPKD